MIKITGFFVCLLAGIGLYAQTPAKGKITISLLNDKKEGVENAAVELIKAKDSSLVKTALSDKTGLAEFENIPFGSYLIRSKPVNYRTAYSNAISLSADNSPVQLPALVLQPLSAELGNVTVNARKPFIQKLTDRIVVNVENSIVSAGSSAMDVATAPAPLPSAVDLAVTLSMVMPQAKGCCVRVRRAGSAGGRAPRARSRPRSECGCASRSPAAAPRSSPPACR